MDVFGGVGASVREWLHYADMWTGLKPLARIAEPPGSKRNVGTGTHTPKGGWRIQIIAPSTAEAEVRRQVKHTGKGIRERVKRIFDFGLIRLKRRNRGAETG